MTTTSIYVIPEVSDRESTLGKHIDLRLTDFEDGGLSVIALNQR